MQKVTFPRMGHYTECFAELIRKIGFEPIIPPMTTQKTIKLGVRHSSDMVCFPFKVTLGNLIEGLDAGADAIMITGLNENTKEEKCRFLYYYYVHIQILKRLGYKFKVYYLKPNLISSLKKINPKLSYIDILKIIKHTYNHILSIEDKYYKFEPKEINIGVVGEAFTLWEPAVNYDIFHKLRKLGVGVHLSISLSWFLKHQVHIADTKKDLSKEVKKYFPKRIGGHGYESIYNTIYYAKNRFNGVIHLLPLTCMPETMVEMVLNMISEDYKISVYRFPIDENRFEAGFDTRLETFIKLLKRNKKGVF